MTATKVGLPEVTTHLRRLESGLIVPATAGTRTFVTQRAMFPVYFDEDFVEYETDVPSGATTPTPSDLYEMTSNGDFMDLLGSFNTNIEPLFWRSQDQIITWVETHPQHLHPNDWATFFPFIVGKKRFVAGVDRYRGGLLAHVNHFDDGYVWLDEFRFRLVLPQLGV